MLRIIQHGGLFLSRTPPKKIHNGAVLFIDRTDNGIRKVFPAFSLMRIRLVSPDRQHRVQHENSLLCPLLQISVVGDVTPQIIVKLRIDVLERRRNPLPRQHGKRQTVSLIGPVIGILPQDQNLHILQSRQMQRIENIVGRRIDGSGIVFLSDKFIQFFIIRFSELSSDCFHPVILQCCHIHSPSLNVFLILFSFVSPSLLSRKAQRLPGQNGFHGLYLHAHGNASVPKICLQITDLQLLIME